MTGSQNYRAGRAAPRRDPTRQWPSYVGITGLLLLIIIALAGGIIWYNSRKSSELAIAAAHRLMQEAEEKVTDRIKLLYDPMYAIVGIASSMPGLTTPAAAEDPNARALILRALRAYPQILSLYVGFDTGNFFMITHMAGAKSAALHKSLHAPPEAAFAEEIVAPGGAGEGGARWIFSAEDGAVVARRDKAATFDPRERPWYRAAKGIDVVARSALYVFASSGEPGFTLSRSFQGPTPGVMGADLAAVDLASFLRRQRITPDSTAFIFTKSGEAVVLPDQTRIASAVHADGQTMADLPKITELHDPVITGLVTAYQDHPMQGTRVFDVHNRTFISRVIGIPARYGQDQLLAIAVPVDEVEQPITDIRNETLLYSLAFLVLALPLYVILVVVWIDRRLERHAPRSVLRDED